MCKVIYVRWITARSCLIVNWIIELQKANRISLIELQKHKNDLLNTAPQLVGYIE